MTSRKDEENNRKKNLPSQTFDGKNTAAVANENGNDNVEEVAQRPPRRPPIEEDGPDLMDQVNSCSVQGLGEQTSSSISISSYSGLEEQVHGRSLEARVAAVTNVITDIDKGIDLPSNTGDRGAAGGVESVEQTTSSAFEGPYGDDRSVGARVAAMIHIISDPENGIDDINFPSHASDAARHVPGAADIVKAPPKNPKQQTVANRHAGPREIEEGKVTGVQGVASIPTTSDAAEGLATLFATDNEEFPLPDYKDQVRDAPRKKGGTRLPAPNEHGVRGVAYSRSC